MDVCRDVGSTSLNPPQGSFFSPGRGRGGGGRNPLGRGGGDTMDEGRFRTEAFHLRLRRLPTYVLGMPTTTCIRNGNQDLCPVLPREWTPTHHGHQRKKTQNTHNKFFPLNRATKRTPFAAKATGSRAQPRLRNHAFLHHHMVWCCGLLLNNGKIAKDPLNVSKGSITHDTRNVSRRKQRISSGTRNVEFKKNRANTVGVASTLALCVKATLLCHSTGVCTETNTFRVSWAPTVT